MTLKRVSKRATPWINIVFWTTKLEPFEFCLRYKCGSFLRNSSHCKVFCPAILYSEWHASVNRFCNKDFGSHTTKEEEAWKIALFFAWIYFKTVQVDCFSARSAIGWLNLSWINTLSLGLGVWNWWQDLSRRPDKWQWRLWFGSDQLIRMLQNLLKSFQQNFQLKISTNSTFKVYEWICRKSEKSNWHWEFERSYFAGIRAMCLNQLYSPERKWISMFPRVDRIWRVWEKFANLSSNAPKNSNSSNKDGPDTDKTLTSLRVQHFGKLFGKSQKISTFRFRVCLPRPWEIFSSPAAARDWRLGMSRHPSRQSQNY